MRQNILLIFPEIFRPYCSMMNNLVLRPQLPFNTHSPSSTFIIIIALLHATFPSILFCDLNFH